MGLINVFVVTSGFKKNFNTKKGIKVISKTYGFIWAAIILFLWEWKQWKLKTFENALEISTIVMTYNLDYNL